jgi:hypothetical protein
MRIVWQKFLLLNKYNVNSQLRLYELFKVIFYV